MKKISIIIIDIIKKNKKDVIIVILEYIKTKIKNQRIFQKKKK